ncbi:MAG: hypothetical protein AAF772_10505, partial [Acidobacteriota bacterium]
MDVRPRALPPVLRAATWRWTPGTPLPEQRLPTWPPAATRDVALCLGGRGPRALAVAAGVLAGLERRDLLRPLRYLCGTGAGAWAAMLTAYLPHGVDDATFFGRDALPTAGRALRALTPDALDAPLDPRSLLAIATTNLAHAFFAPYALDAHARWLHAVDQAVLAPLGLDARRAQHPIFFGFDDAAIADLLRRNPALDARDVLRMRSDRPFPVVSATLRWPLRVLPQDETHLRFEITPLAAGLPAPVDRSYRRLWLVPERLRAGGSFVEPFALQGRGLPSYERAPVARDAPATDAPARLAVVTTGDQRFQLTDALGACAAFPADADTDTAEAIATTRLPLTLHSLPAADAPAAPPAAAVTLGDGGAVDPCGIIGALLRRAARLLVIVDLPRPPAVDDPVPAVLRPLFARADGRARRRWSRGRRATDARAVFPQPAWAALRDAWSTALRAGQPLIHRASWSVLD